MIMDKFNRDEQELLIRAAIELYSESGDRMDVLSRRQKMLLRTGIRLQEEK